MACAWFGPGKGMKNKPRASFHAGLNWAKWSSVCQQLSVCISAKQRGSSQTKQAEGRGGQSIRDTKIKCQIKRLIVLFFIFVQTSDGAVEEVRAGSFLEPGAPHPGGGYPSKQLAGIHSAAFSHQRNPAPSPHPLSIHFLGIYDGSVGISQPPIFVAAGGPITSPTPPP